MKRLLPLLLVLLSSCQREAAQHLDFTTGVESTATAPSPQTVAPLTASGGAETDGAETDSPGATPSAPPSAAPSDTLCTPQQLTIVLQHFDPNLEQDGAPYCTNPNFAHSEECQAVVNNGCVGTDPVTGAAITDCAQAACLYYVSFLNGLTSAEGDVTSVACVPTEALIPGAPPPTWSAELIVPLTAESERFVEAGTEPLNGTACTTPDECCANKQAFYSMGPSAEFPLGCTPMGDGEAQFGITISVADGGDSSAPICGAPAPAPSPSPSPFPISGM